jgi:hypothetical protein
MEWIVFRLKPFADDMEIMSRHASASEAAEVARQLKLRTGCDHGFAQAIVPALQVPEKPTPAESPVL